MEDSKSSSSHNNSNRHPPNLRGKAIGLWYAQRQRSANSASASSHPRPRPPQPVATIELSPREIQRVTEVRHLFKNQPHSQKHFEESSAKIDENPTMDDAEHSVQFDRLHSSFQYFEPLSDKPEVNKNLFDDLQAKQSSSLYQNLTTKRSRLPISAYQQEILHTIEQNQIFVLIGETGSGESR